MPAKDSINQLRSRALLCVRYAAGHRVLTCGVVVQVTVGLNNMRYRGKSGYGGNVSTQYAATPGTTVMGNLQLNNERAGKMTMRINSHDYPNLGVSLLVPTVAYLWGRIRGRD